MKREVGLGAHSCGGADEGGALHSKHKDKGVQQWNRAAAESAGPENQTGNLKPEHNSLFDLGVVETEPQ